MDYTVHSVNNQPVGDITFNTGPMGFVTFEKGGGTLSDADVENLAVFKKGGKWMDSIFLRAVKSGRIRIAGDRELEQAFAVDVPEPRAPGRAKVKSRDELLKEVQADQAKLAEKMVALEAMTSKAAKAAKKPVE